MGKRDFSGANPFDNRTPKQHFTVLNRKVAGAKTVQQTKAQSNAISKRKKSLLVDLQNVNKDNSFIDHRFGENRRAAEGLSNDDKYLERFQKERMKQLRKYKNQNGFSVEDEDQLTHLGQSLSTISNIDGAGGHGEGSDFEDNGKISSEEVQVSHFGGGDFEKEKERLIAQAKALLEYPDPTPEQRSKMSKREIMIDLIRKSKFFKMQKQISSTQQSDMADNIDALFDQIRNLVEVNHRHDEKGGVTIEDGFASIGIDGKPLLKKGEEVIDEFASEALKLQFEKKAIPTDRLKSAEEVAKENREKLLQLEKERLRRMHGGDVDLDDDFKDGKNDESSEEEYNQPNRKLTMAERRKKRRQEIRNAKRQERLAEEGKLDDYVPELLPSDDDVDDLGLDSSSEVDEEDGLEEDEEDEEEVDSVSQVIEDEENPLPFVFDAPKSFKDFMKLFDARGPETLKAISEYEIIIQRLCTLYNVKAAPENTPKMENLFRYLFRYLNNTCEDEAVRISTRESFRSAKSGIINKEKSVNYYTCPLTTAKVDFITRQTFELMHMFPKFASKTTRDFINALHTTLHDRVSADSENISEELMKADVANLYIPEARSDMPTAQELFSIQLLSKLFPTSDYRHSITTPIFIMLNECLTSLPVRGGRDILVGLVIISMLLDYTIESKRYIPEIISFLHSSLITLFGFTPESKTNSNKQNDTTKKSKHVAIHARNDEHKKYQFQYAQKNFLPTVNMLKTMDIHSQRVKCFFKDPITETTTQNDKLPLSLIFLPHNNFNVFNSKPFLQLLLIIITKLIYTASQRYANLQSFPEIFSPIYTTIESIIARQLVPENVATNTYNETTYETLPNTSTMYDYLKAVLVHLEFKSKQVQRSRKPLARYSQLESIKELTPSFDENFNPNKNKDPNKERAELRELQKKVNRERKSAIREIRRDTQFIANEKSKELAKKDEERAREKKRVWSEIEAEARDTNITATVSKKKVKKVLEKKRQAGK